MVKSVHGHCDGVYIAFTQDADTGRWTAAVPATMNGEYIVDVYAEDDVGNVAYMAKMLFAVDPERLCVQVTVLSYGSAAAVRLLGADTSKRVISANAEKSEFSADLWVKNYTACLSSKIEGG